MKRSFLFLAVLTSLSVLVLWVFAIKDSALETTGVNTLLLPEISKQINDVSRVEIISAGNKPVATLLKTEHGWQLEQMGGYRADWKKLQTLLATLAQARVIEPKTDKVEYYTRLGVEDVAVEDAGSVLVMLSIGEQTTGILIGHQAQGRQGQYVRLQNSAASALVDREFVVSSERLDWADSTILDINASEVAEVEIIHAQGESLLVTKISADQTDFDLVALPRGREIKSSWAVNSLGSVFSMLNMETVRPVGDVVWNDAVKMRLLMFSGVEIMADMVTAGDEYLLRLHASHPAADVVNKQTKDQQDAVAQQAAEKRAENDVAMIVEDINQKTTAWAYGISKQKYDAMVKTPEDLLKPLESP